MDDVRAALSALLAAPKFQALEDRLRERSIFHVLGIETREIYHSRLLAWLLDPREAHGLGTRPLRTFLLMATWPGFVQGPIDAVAVDELDLDAAVVTPEFTIDDGRRLDVLVSIGDRPILVIEYKVDAAEGDEQTADYASWAALQAKALDCPPPVLVFLCPVRDDDTQPAAPFVHLAYEPYCAWLEDLAARAKDDRSRVLVQEFLACLRQRDDVSAPELRGLTQAIEQEHAAALEVLRAATRVEKRSVEAVMQRHDRPLAKLGVTVGRRTTYGPSAFVAKVRAVVGATLTREYWEVGGGEGSLSVAFKPAAVVIERVLGADATLVIKFYAGRPTRGGARLILGAWVSASGPAARALGTRTGESLGNHVRTRLGKHPGRPPAAASIRIDLPEIQGPEDDTPDGVEACGDRIAAAVQLIRDAEPDLIDWTKGVLPKLLELAPTGGVAS